MIGIKDTLELTAVLHGGKRLADKVSIAETYREKKDQAQPGVNKNWHTRSTRRESLRRTPKLITLPGISDELSRYRPKSTTQAA